MQKLTINSGRSTNLIDISSQVKRVVDDSQINSGLCVVFVPHTTAGITINENADPDVQSDMLKELNKIVPFNDDYQHSEGNSAAHIKTSMVGSSEVIIIENGGLQLGTWQGIYLCEFDGPRNRQVWIKIIAG